jgi:hypothetical protein
LRHKAKNPIKGTDFLIPDSTELQPSSLEQRFLNKLSDANRDLGVFRDIFEPPKQPKNKYKSIEAKVHSVRSLRNQELLGIVEKPQKPSNLDIEE